MNGHQANSINDVDTRYAGLKRRRGSSPPV